MSETLQKTANKRSSTSMHRQGMRVSVVEGAWATVHGTLTTGTFLTGFALFLGSNDLQLALITAVPLLAQVFQIPGAWLAMRWGNRKCQVAWFSLIGRSLWVPAVMIPIVFPGGWVKWFLIVYAVSSIAMNVSAPAWMAWMSDLVPGGVRGRYFGMRNGVVGGVTMAASLAGGVVIDAARSHQNEYGGYQILIAAAVAAALAAFVCILLQPDVRHRHRHAAAPSAAARWFQPLKDPIYGRVLAFYIYWLFAVGLASPFFAAHQLKNLDWTFRGMAALGILSAAVALICNPWWGKAIDRYGHRPVLTTASLGILPLPLYYAFCPPGISWPLYTNAFFAGVFWSGFNLAMFSLLMHDLPAVGRPFYFAVAAALSGAINFAASLCGGLLAESWSGHSIDIGFVTLGNYQLLFLLTTVCRVPGLLLLRRIHEPGAQRSAVLIRQAFIEINRRIGLGRQIFLLKEDNEDEPDP